MITHENECVCCDLPCIKTDCPYYDVIHLYCDICNEETNILYEYEYKEICQECLLKAIPKIEIDK